jgi:hypothetical protein
VKPFQSFAIVFALCSGCIPAKAAGACEEALAGFAVDAAISGFSESFNEHGSVKAKP